MIKVTIKLEDFRQSSDEPYFVTETVSESSGHIADVLDCMRRTLMGHTFGEGLVNQYLNWDEKTCTILPIEEKDVYQVYKNGILRVNGVDLGMVSELQFIKG